MGSVNSCVQETVRQRFLYRHFSLVVYEEWMLFISFFSLSYHAVTIAYKISKKTICVCLCLTNSTEDTYSLRQVCRPLSNIRIHGATPYFHCCFINKLFRVFLSIYHSFCQQVLFSKTWLFNRFILWNIIKVNDSK